MYIEKAIRKEVHAKCNGHCGYCGKDLPYGKMQVDHIEPHWHNMSEEKAARHDIKKGKHSLENFMPACARCNRWKSTFTIEKFRQQISLQIKRLKRDVAGFRMARDFNLIEETGQDVSFYFEQINEE